MDGAAGTVFNHCWHRFQNVLLLLPCSSRDAAPGSSRNPCPGIVQDTAVQGLCSLIPAEIPVQDTAVQGFCSLIPAEILVQGFCSLIPAEFPAQDTADHLTAPSPHKILLFLCTRKKPNPMEQNSSTQLQGKSTAVFNEHGSN